MGALFVGVDGGGTSTRCVVVTESGEIAGRGRAGGANAISVPDPVANLRAALLGALEGLDPARVAGGVFGLAGTARAAESAERAWREAGLAGHPAVVADVLVAFTGASDEPDGAVLVAGTGAIGARIRDRRVVRRADGLGWLLGDEGSGVWLGRRAAAAALNAIDGRGAPTVLVARVAETVLGPGAAGEDDGPALARDLVAAVYARVAESGPAWLGTLAPVVDAAAREGDEVARGVVAEAARRLCRTARVVAGEGARERGARGGGEPLVLAGSLLTEPTELAHLVRAELGRWARLVSARDSAAGAAALAVRAALPGDPRAAQAHRALIEQGGA
ncbi:N-acetylglucosamine kinase [Microbispora rosea subsp. aerata]|nr:BadF/BadG/BcrA/BcrD ATPase family protein [Microbispora rosea]GGO19901.1 N-acetylglucosamine kinase [Microbispora rosea subsp. aerata]GIH57036.1 N-acetylglucosamine kinase [Microbispora rosea subsp. aerata]GLJ83493.1 N-acetylglucosamine kinase [Microbispora rosea subsp. aerata]